MWWKSLTAIMLIVPSLVMAQQSIVIDIDPDIRTLMGNVGYFHLGMTREHLLTSHTGPYMRIHESPGLSLTYTNGTHKIIVHFDDTDNDAITRTICWTDPSLLVEKTYTLDNYLAFPDEIVKEYYKNGSFFKHRTRKLFFLGQERGCIYR